MPSNIQLSLLYNTLNDLKIRDTFYTEKSGRKITKGSAVSSRDKTYKALTDIDVSDDIFFFTTEEKDNYAIAANITENNKVISSRTTLSRHARPFGKRLGQSFSEADYAILYTVDYETKLEFWIATFNYEVLVHTLPKERVLSEISAFLPGMYLVIWAEGLYATDEPFLSATFTPRNGENLFVPERYGNNGQLDRLFVGTGGSHYFFGLEDHNKARLPRPSGLPAPFFTGEYLIPEIGIFYNIFSNSEIEYQLQTSVLPFSVTIPSDAIFRTSVSAVFGRNIGSGSNPGFYEYTGYSLPGQNTWMFGWVPPAEITSKGFSREDGSLSYIFNTRGGVWARVLEYDQDFSYTWALIPHNQSPGSAHPASNRAAFERGANGYNFKPFFPEEVPTIIFDGRSNHTPGPDTRQPVYVIETHEAYLSTLGRSPVFYIKSGDAQADIKPVTTNNPGATNPKFVNAELKRINQSGGVVSLDKTIGPLRSTSILALREDFIEWKAYKRSLNHFFEQLTSPRNNGTFFDLGLALYATIATRNKAVAQFLNTPGYYVDNEIFVGLPFGGIAAFLANPASPETETFEFSFAQYTTTVLEDLWSDKWVDYELEVTPLPPASVIVKKPGKLTQLLAKDPDSVNIIDIVPLVSRTIQNAINQPNE
jgi:hypothetical protein